jgi:O-antigen/teichoic acid export membrane protein
MSIGCPAAMRGISEGSAVAASTPPGAEQLPSDPVTAPLGRSAAVGALWLTAQKWVVRLSGFVTIAILTRLISPEDFGVVAAAATITPFVLLLADLGLSTYIVQADAADSRMLSTGFWFSALAGTALAAGMALSAPLLAAAFNIEGSTDVLRVMALSVLLTVLASVPTALLKRRLQFRRIAVQATVAAVIAQVVAVVLALAGTGAWALVGQLLVSQAVAGVLAWRAARWRPGAEFSAPEFRVMAQFGTKVVGVEVVAALRAAGEAAVIANVLGAAALGFLSIAQRLVQVAQDVSASALVPVSTVVFARVRDSRERLRAGYVRALRIGYAAVTPALALLVVAAPTLIPMIFGPGWEPSVPVARALAAAAILVLGAMIDHGLLYGVGAPGRWFAYALVIDVLTLGTTFVLAPRGLPWVAAGFVVVALVATVARWFLVGHVIGLPAHRLAGTFLLDMVPVMVSIAVGLAVHHATGGLPSPVAVALIGTSIGIAHLVTVWLVNRRVLADALDVLPLPPRLSALRRLA